MNKTKTEWVVLGLTDDIKEKEIGSFKTKREAEMCIHRNIRNFRTYGMGLVKMPYLQAQWNYELDENGQLWSRRNHHDLW